MNHGRVYLVLLFAFVAIVGESGLMLASSAANAGDKTFGGRTFDDWKVLAVNDLDPQTRAKAMSAIGVLGHNGHRAAAIEVLQRAIASESDATVARAGYAAILSFGDDSIAATEAGLSAEDENKRRVALRALSGFFSRKGPAENNAKLNTLPKRIIPKLLALLQDPKVNLGDRVTATKTLEGVLRLRDPEEFAKNVLQTLMQLVESPDTELAAEALRTIGQLGEHARPAVLLLVSFVEKEEASQRTSTGRTVSRRMSAVVALGYLGPIAKDAVPALEKLQKSASVRGLSRIVERILEKIRGEPHEE